MKKYIPDSLALVLISDSSETFKPLASEITREDAFDATSFTSLTIFTFSSLDNATAILQLKPFGYPATNCIITICTPPT